MPKSIDLHGQCLSSLCISRQDVKVRKKVLRMQSWAAADRFDARRPCLQPACRRGSIGTDVLAVPMSSECSRLWLMRPVRVTSGRGNQPPLLECLNHQLHGVGQILLARIDLQFGRFRGLIGAGDAGEFLDLPRPCLGVKAFRIAGFADIEIGGAEHLEEVTVLHKGAGLVAIGAEGGDEGGQHDHACVEKQLGHFTDAADVLLTVGIGEAQVFAEPVADVVSIQHVGGEPPLEQSRIHSISQGALAGPGESGEPEDGAAVTALL